MATFPPPFLEINIDRVCATISRRFQRFGEATSPSLRRGLSLRTFTLRVEGVCMSKIVDLVKGVWLRAKFPSILWTYFMQAAS